MRIPDEDRAILLSWARSFSVPAGAALRACIVLASAQGQGPSQVTTRLAVSRPAVIAWRERYRAGGIAALADAPRSGRPTSGSSWLPRA